MGQYRHVGTFTEIMDTRFRFERWGQVAELPDALAKRAIEDGAQLLPSADFDSHGVTADELKKYASVPTHAKATPEFIAKRNALWGRVAELKADIAMSNATPAMPEPEPSHQSTEEVS